MCSVAVLALTCLGIVFQLFLQPIDAYFHTFLSLAEGFFFFFSLFSDLPKIEKIEHFH